MIVIIDYGMGNLNSILNLLKKIRVNALISSDPVVIKDASKLILPGVGAFDSGMKNIRERGLAGVLETKVRIEKTPVLGICLGMHLFAKESEEGCEQGLGWIDAKAVKFLPHCGEIKRRVPHMGWNTIEVEREHLIFNGLMDEARFYFVHSYYIHCADSRDSLAKTDYGGLFTSVVQRSNILGVQFHPEKSHKFGMQLLANFSSWNGEDNHA